MGCFSIPISTAVKRFNNKITFIQPMIEAISNSLEANAKEITVKVFLENVTDLSGDIACKIKGYSIIDDGDGFNDENINSFLTYMSEHKIKLGCKGVGRITWLKVFDKITIESCFANKKVYFDFNLFFEKDKIKTEEIKEVVSNKTIVNFSNVNSKFYKNGKYDYREDGNLQQLRDVIEESLLVKLSLLKSTGKDFIIKFESSNSEVVDPITCNSIPKLKQKTFMVSNQNEHYSFDIFYSFLENHKNIISSAYFCANGRTVKKVRTNIIPNLPKEIYSIILVSSDYLDAHVNNERNEFDIIEEGEIGFLSWDNIYNKLVSEIEEILVTEFPNFKDDNEKNIKELIDEYPHLCKYIKEDTSLIKNKERIITDSKKKFEKDKIQVSKKFKTMLSNNKIDSEEFDNVIKLVSEISALELAEYFVYRQQIIDALKKISEDSDKSEKKLHDLFMKQRTDSKKSEHNIYDNNLWLFDDKFMSYVYASSDLEISKIKKALDDEYGDPKYRPDLALFYSRSQDSKDKDAILIEFKACGASLDEKSKAMWEINRNAKVIRKTISNINRLWCYSITQFTDKLIENLESNDYKPLFSNQDEQDIYYRYFENISAHCYYISIESLLKDADIRNNLFINIIKGIN